MARMLDKNLWKLSHNEGHVKPEGRKEHACKEWPIWNSLALDEDAMSGAYALSAELCPM